MTKKQAQGLGLVLLGVLPIIVVGGAIMYVLFTTDIGNAPISALPAWYWALLACIPIMTLLSLIFTHLSARRITVTKTTSTAETKALAWFSVAGFAFTTVVFLGISILNINSRHQGGGQSMFSIAIGIQQLVLLGFSVIRLRTT
ncbi:MAG TPA: hypothetical protein VEX13_13605 [Chloroflexia bacterium]|nr:hypothetical protein [Chloroflexia bacterium]